MIASKVVIQAGQQPAPTLVKRVWELVGRKIDAKLWAIAEALATEARETNNAEALALLGEIYEQLFRDWQEQQDYHWQARNVILRDGRMVRVSAKEWERLVREGLL